MQFTPWPKIARLNRDIVVTEKIDGTNAAIIIEPWSNLVMETSEGHNWSEDYYRQWGKNKDRLIAIVGTPITKSFEDSTWVEYGQDAFAVFAQSRKRLIKPGDDNFGFAAWVEAHAVDLVTALGPGTHFGEWWGSGIQRGYGQPKGVRHFSLFNTDRYAGVDLIFKDGSRVRPVPVLEHYGRFDANIVKSALVGLSYGGSVAAPGFDRPEGVVVFHTAAQTMFKVLLEGDDAPKGQA